LAARPDGGVKESDFRFETVSVPEPDENEMLLETQYLSLDPYMRARMDAVKSYAALAHALFVERRECAQA
jgi:NADPH-dependent curcumin reductase